MRRAAAAIDRRGRVLLGLGLVALATVTLILAHRKPLWNDELFTLYISRLPSVSGMWDILATGVEQTPLTFYLLTRGSLEALGDGPVAIRLPELLGFLLASVCVYLFVERRASPLYGLVAALLPVATIAYGYAYEARAYGLVLGFSAAALLCWQVAAEGGRHRRLAAAGTALALAAAVASHYYAVLVVAPLLVGEAVRSVERRRVDWTVAASFGGALVPLVAFAPLIAEAKDYSTTFWAQPTWGDAARFYPDSLMDRALFVVLAAVAVAFVAAAWRRPDRARHAGLRRPPTYELAALATLALLPAFAVLMGKLVTGAFTDRYALPALLAASILLALAAWWTDARQAVLGLALLAVLGAFAVQRIYDRYGEASADAHEQDAAVALLTRDGPPGGAVVVASPHDFFELSHRMAGSARPRVVYLADAAEARRRLETDAVELGVTGMARVAPLRVEPYRRFLASHPRFVVYGREGAWDWLSSALRDARADTTVVARNPEDGAPLLDVRRGRAAP